MIVVALSPARIACGVPVVLPEYSPHVGMLLPSWRVIVEDIEVIGSGIIAMTGNPTAPVHPQSVTGLGVSAMNRLRSVVVPLPGQTIGLVGRGSPVSPEITLSAARSATLGLRCSHTGRSRLYEGCDAAPRSHGTVRSSRVRRNRGPVRRSSS